MRLIDELLYPTVFLDVAPFFALRLQLSVKLCLFSLESEVIDEAVERCNILLFLR